MQGRDLSSWFKPVWRIWFRFDQFQWPLLIIYWPPKIHKNLTGTRVPNNSRPHLLSDNTPKVLKEIYCVIEIYITKFISILISMFGVVRNSISILSKLNKINFRKSIWSISGFDFTTLFNAITHKFPIKTLSQVIYFIFKAKLRKSIDHSGNCTTGFSTSSKILAFLGLLSKQCYGPIFSILFCILICQKTCSNLVH